MRLIITCEHAVNTIPDPFSAYFKPHDALMQTHRACDLGALAVAKKLHHYLNAPFFQATTSRLLIECNRSLTHPQCFSFISKAFPQALKDQLIHDYYQPYRQRVLDQIQDLIQANHVVLHLSIHSFTPVFNDIERHADIGLLYDPARQKEQALAKTWQKQLRQQAPDLQIRRNYPYLGKTDGFTSFCRKHFPEEHYLGFEIEMNQAKVVHAACQERFADELIQLL